MDFWRALEIAENYQTLLTTYNQVEMHSKNESKEFHRVVKDALIYAIIVENELNSSAVMAKEKGYCGKIKLRPMLWVKLIQELGGNELARRITYLEKTIETSVNCEEGDEWYRLIMDVFNENSGIAEVRDENRKNA